jgi:hypothetical protein
MAERFLRSRLPNGCSQRAEDILCALKIFRGKSCQIGHPLGNFGSGKRWQLSAPKREYARVVWIVHQRAQAKAANQSGGSQYYRCTRSHAVLPSRFALLKLITLLYQFSERLVLLTQAFCHCYYQMAVQQVSIRSKISRTCKQEVDLMLATLDFECG